MLAVKKGRTSSGLNHGMGLGTANTRGPPVLKKPTQVSFGFAQRNLKSFYSKLCRAAWKVQERGADWGPYT